MLRALRFDRDSLMAFFAKPKRKMTTENVLWILGNALCVSVLTVTVL